MYRLKYLLLALLMLVNAPLVLAGELPSQMLERTSQQVLDILRNDLDELKKDPDQVYQIVDKYILPYVDQVTMAKLALGKHWRKASREQKRAFVNAFRDLLVRTYSKSMLEFQGQDLRFYPVRDLAPDAVKAQVKAEVIQPGGPPIPLVYRLRQKNGKWLVYDIKVDGISLVTSYRGTFTQEIRKSGIDGLLEYLQDKGRTLDVLKKKESEKA